MHIEGDFFLFKLITIWRIDFMKNNENYLIKELCGDTLTPIAIIQKISGTKKFLLESSNKYLDTGRFSFIGTNPVMEFIACGDQCKIIKPNSVKSLNGDPIELLKTLLPKVDIKDLEYPFLSGAIGYIAYDIVRQFEDIGIELKDDLEMPDIHLMFYDEVIIYDHQEEKIILVGVPILEETTLCDLEIKLTNRLEELSEPNFYSDIESPKFEGFKSDISKHQFIKNIEIAKKHIKAGDIFQVVLSQRMRSEFSGTPFEIYRNHRTNNPTPYMYYIDFTSYQIIGSSPESLVKTKGDDVTTNPIAGTIKRGKTTIEDHALEKLLKNDEKELAEHKMLVDLSRNDLGKISKFGSVKLTKYIEIEKFRHVIHLVSEVNGTLNDESNAMDALKACIPAGTVSGAPKIRAMEIINNLETSKRGVYSGAVGYLSVNGNMDFALAIRTMILKDGVAVIQAGAGIVYDSNPESEFEETLNKLKSFLEVYKNDTNN
jgi:anthranilate synthase component 1